MNSTARAETAPEAYFLGVITSQLKVNAFQEVTVDIDDLPLIEKIADLTSNNESVRPILLPRVEEGVFNRSSQPYYFCKNEQDALTILSNKADIFMRATQEKSTEIPVKLFLYRSEKDPVDWSSSENIDTFEAVLKTLFHIPKPLFNKKNSAGVKLETGNFLTENLLINYQKNDFSMVKNNLSFRLVWCEFTEKVTGYFSVGSFVALE